MEKKNIVVFGAGGFGREVMFYLHDINSQKNCYNILGFIDDTHELHLKTINGHKVIGNSQWLLNYPDEISVLIGIGNPIMRKSIFEKLSQNAFIKFPKFISDNVKISDTVNIGDGSIICPGNIITVNINIGKFFICNIDCTIGHDSIIGDFVTIAPGVHISGYVQVGSSSDIGTGTNIIERKRIGDCTIIGAGSTIIKDIPANCTAVGVPAKPIKFHSNDVQEIKQT